MFRTLAIAALLALFVPVAAAADPRLDEKVYSPFILKGVGELEARVGAEAQGALGGSATTVIEAGYGVGDRLSVALVGRMEREPSGPLRLDAVGVETVTYLGQIPGVAVDAGLYLEYDQGVRGGESAGEAKLLLAKTAGRFQGLLNLIVERPLGVPAGEGYANYGYAVSATWRTFGALRIGAEAFGDLGDDHGFPGRPGAYVGPQLKWRGRPGSSPVEIEVDAGWLAAVGPARREGGSQLRLVVELERRF